MPELRREALLPDVLVHELVCRERLSVQDCTLKLKVRAALGFHARRCSKTPSRSCTAATAAQRGMMDHTKMAMDSHARARQRTRLQKQS